jgi:hypothetical protein
MKEEQKSKSLAISKSSQMLQAKPKKLLSDYTVNKEEYETRRLICNECSGGWLCSKYGCMLWAKAALDTFIDEAFNLDGSYKSTDHQPQPSKSNCMYCPYKDKKELCNKSILL